MSAKDIYIRQGALGFRWRALCEEPYVRSPIHPQMNTTNPLYIRQKSRQFAKNQDDSSAWLLCVHQRTHFYTPGIGKSALVKRRLSRRQESVLPYCRACMMIICTALWWGCKCPSASVLCSPCVAVCCSVLQCVCSCKRFAVRCCVCGIRLCDKVLNIYLHPFCAAHVLQCVCAFRRVAVHCNVLQCLCKGCKCESASVLCSRAGIICV